MGRGALVFKGEGAPKKKKSKKKHSSTSKKDDVYEAHPGPSILPPVVRPQQQKTQESPSLPAMKEGTGRITTSGTVVTGIGSRFDKELDVGDAMIVTIDGTQEMRVVTMRLSKTSCAISSSFSENCKLPTPFFVIQKPRNKEKEHAMTQLQAKQEKEQAEKQAFGTYGTNEELVYREKTEHGSYRIQRVKVDDANVTRGDLLNMRSKRKSDKYC